MPLTPATCPKCGGTLDVDSELEAAVCKYCGTPFIVEKAINVFNTTHNTTYVTNSTNTTNISNSEVHIHQDGKDAQKLFENLKAQISRKDINSAYRTLEKLKDDFPADLRTYEADFLCAWYRKTEDLIDSGRITYDDEFNSFSKLISVNREVGIAYSEQIKTDINTYLNKTYGKDFTGDLVFYKIALASVFQYIHRSIASLIKTGIDHIQIKTGIDYIREIVETDMLFNVNIPNEPKGYDDEFCLFAIDKINDYKRVLKKETDIATEKYDAIRNGILNRLMSPSGKAKYEEKMLIAAEQKKQREKETLKANITKLWSEYTRLLKIGKTKEAYEFMQKDCSYKFRDEELKNFKKTLFGMKYLGSALNKSTDELLKEMGLN